MMTAATRSEPVRAARQTAGKLTLRPATSEDRPIIYRLRHQVYASELGQLPENPEQMLRDTLDEINEYILACRGPQIVGFVSITPPNFGRYSIDKYVPREDLRLANHERLYEVRLLTVIEPLRRSGITPLLMHAALRRIEQRGGEQIIAMGRREVLGLYRKAGFEPLERIIRSGAVTYELMGTDVERARRHAAQHHGLIRQLLEIVDWRLDVSPFDAEACEHGGAFFRAIGEDFATLGRRTSIINADLLDAWFPPAPQVLECLQAHLD